MNSILYKVFKYNNANYNKYRTCFTINNNVNTIHNVKYDMYLIIYI